MNAAMRSVADVVSVLDGINWESLEAVRAVSYDLLRSIAANELLLEDLLSQAIASSRLRGMFEHYDILDKVVLLDHRRTGARLRLHVFLPGYFDRPHDHRWKYTTLILRGGYKHYSFLPQDYSREEAIEQMQPSVISYEREGHSYTYDARMFHSILAEPHTVSLVLRGPSEKEKFLVVDRSEKRAWWQYGAGEEDETERLSKRMTAAQLKSTLALLREKGLIRQVLSVID